MDFILWIVGGVWDPYKDCVCNGLPFMLLAQCQSVLCKFSMLCSHVVVVVNFLDATNPTQSQSLDM